MYEHFWTHIAHFEQYDKPILLKKRILFILCLYYYVMGCFSSFILTSLQVENMKMYCFDDSIDCTFCQQSHFVQKHIV